MQKIVLEAVATSQVPPSHLSILAQEVFNASQRFSCTLFSGKLSFLPSNCVFLLQQKKTETTHPNKPMTSAQLDPDTIFAYCVTGHNGLAWMNVEEIRLTS